MCILCRHFWHHAGNIYACTAPCTHSIPRRSDGGDFVAGEQLLVVQKLWLVVEDDVQRGAVVPAKYLARVGSKHVQVDVVAGEGSWRATAFVCDSRVSG